MSLVVINKYTQGIFTGQSFSQLDKQPDGSFNMLLAFMQCRTHMSDALFDLKHNTNVSSYTFDYKKTKFNWKKGNTYIGITFDSILQKSTFISNFHILNEKEGLAFIKPSVLHETKDDLTMVIEGDKYWKNACWKIQLYTFYLRSICYKDIYYYYKSYWTKISKYETILLTRLKSIKEPYTGIKAYSSVHNDTGPYAICSGSNKTMADYLGITV